MSFVNLEIKYDQYWYAQFGFIYSSPCLASLHSWPSTVQLRKDSWKSEDSN